MARDLLYEAQVTAAAQVAPQVAALREALAVARADRNSAIRASATSYAGLSGAIHRAGGQVREVFRGAKRSARGTDLIARQGLAGLASSPGVDTIKAAYAHEGAVGGAVVAKSLASRLADLSDKRIAAAAGRAFAVNKANSDYSAAAATNAQKRSDLAHQEGLLVGSNYSKLSEAQADRDLRVNLQNDSQAFEGHQNALGRRQQRLDRVADRRSDAAQRSFTADQNARDRKNARLINDADNRAAAQRAGGTAKPTATVLNQRTKIAGLRDIYGKVKADGSFSPEKGVTLKSMTDVANYARRKGAPDSVVLAAANLATKGYVAPREIRELENLGISLPQEWTPQVVKPHTRKRRARRK